MDYKICSSFRPKSNKSSRTLSKHWKKSQRWFSASWVSFEIIKFAETWRRALSFYGSKVIIIAQRLTTNSRYSRTEVNNAGGLQPPLLDVRVLRFFFILKEHSFMFSSEQVFRGFEREKKKKFITFYESFFSVKKRS